MDQKDRIIALAAYYNLSIREFEKECDLKRGNISNMSGYIGSDKLAKIFDRFPELNILWIISGKGDMLNGKSKIVDQQNYDSGDFIEVPITEISAAAGGGTSNSDYFDVNGVIKLPRHMLKKGEHLCISIDGRSMEPTIIHGSQLIVRLFDKSDWKHIKSGDVYVITDREGATYVKRVENNLNDNGTIKFISDNDNKRSYASFSLSESEIHNVWEVEYYLTSKLPDIDNNLPLRVSSLENDIFEIKTMLKKGLKGC